MNCERCEGKGYIGKGTPFGGAETCASCAGTGVYTLRPDPRDAQLAEARYTHVTFIAGLLGAAPGEDTEDAARRVVAERENLSRFVRDMTELGHFEPGSGRAERDEARRELAEAKEQKLAVELDRQRAVLRWSGVALDRDNARRRLEEKDVELAEARAEVARLRTWIGDGDEPLPEDAAIEAAFPTRSGRHDLYAEARRLVGARRSKAGLVALVTWLLVEVDEVRARLPGTPDHLTEDGWMRIGALDAVGRRSLWYRRLPPYDGETRVMTVELCAGREGDDAHVLITRDDLPAETLSALVDVLDRAADAVS